MQISFSFLAGQQIPTGTLAFTDADPNTEPIVVFGSEPTVEWNGLGMTGLILAESKYGSQVFLPMLSPLADFGNREAKNLTGDVVSSILKPGSQVLLNFNQSVKKDLFSSELQSFIPFTAGNGQAMIDVLNKEGLRQDNNGLVLPYIIMGPKVPYDSGVLSGEELAERFLKSGVGFKRAIATIKRKLAQFLAPEKPGSKPDPQGVIGQKTTPALRVIPPGVYLVTSILSQRLLKLGLKLSLLTGSDKSVSQGIYQDKTSLAGRSISMAFELLKTITARRLSGFALKLAITAGSLITRTALLLQNLAADRLSREAVDENRYIFGLNKSQAAELAQIVVLGNTAASEGTISSESIAERPSKSGSLWQKLLTGVSGRDEAIKFNTGHTGQRSDNSVTVLPPGQLAQWSDNIQDLLDLYKGQVDELSLPAADYKYIDEPGQIYDLNTGVPYHPLGVDTATGYIEVEKPFAAVETLYEDLGREPMVVDTIYLIEAMIFLRKQHRQLAASYMGFDIPQALTQFIGRLRAEINDNWYDDPGYLRVFQFVRWYAESLIINNSRYYLKRTYGKWLSHEADGYIGRNEEGITHSGWTVVNGIIQTTLGTGTVPYIQLSMTNYVDGCLKFSSMVEGSSSALVSVTLDGKLIINANVANQMTWNIPAGSHIVRFEAKGKPGDVVKLSAISLEGIKFNGAEMVAKSPEGSSFRGLQMLMEMLLKYYRDHHVDKVKGSRKRWLKGGRSK